MISKEEVIHIAKLARLELTEAEVLSMQKDLSAILDYFDILKKAPKATKATEATKAVNATRKDTVLKQSANLANNLIAQAPNKQDDYIKVKAIL